MFLGVLRMNYPTLPRDPRTLMPTRRDCPKKYIGSGVHVHFGLEKALLHHLSLPGNDDYTSAQLQLHIDRVSPFNASKTQLWPILGRTVSPSTWEPFIVKGHSGYFGCDKCTQDGIRVARRLTFPSSHSPLRTHESFILQSNPAHHIGDSPICDIPIDMVSTFPLDYMHLVCLGVMERMLNLWLFSPVDRNLRLSANSVTVISARISDLQADIPCDFPRRCRPLTEVTRWKATEFHQFPMVPVGFSSDDEYGSKKKGTGRQEPSVYPVPPIPALP
ncbi:uncharacterized protein DEA37_0005753 [Paragonimus westermani]|uniref:Uncharacterized protein n=1 Tax=Paragonimus westermani TaxID=34504 RepID=A0A5J4NSP1_9TREM|nr:uncharacterized protein DEA37_0005753 [Paragonimus westermani]